MIHPTAIIDTKAELASGVSVGPYSVIGPKVKIDSGTIIGPHVVISGETTIGKGNQFYQFCSVGEAPQDLKYADEETKVVIGDNNKVRECVTIHRGTIQAESLTSIGSNNLFMAYSHVAHDCILGNNIVLANTATLAGHIQLGDYAIISAFCALHQFVKVGPHAFVSHGALCSKDIPPFVVVAGMGGTNVSVCGINSEGLKRRGFSSEEIEALRQAYKIIYRQGLKASEAVNRLIEYEKEHPIVRHFRVFFGGFNKRYCPIMIICMCAGEASGDTLGADYISQLKRQYPGAKFYGIGGPKMIQAGLYSWFDMEALSVMGITAVLQRLPQILRIRHRLYRNILSIQADLFIGIDSPDFNLSLEKKLKAKGIKTIHYVSPTIWAWRPGRIHAVIAATHEVLCLFPFEVPLYEQYGHKASFVGHPLARAIPLEPDKCSAKASFGFRSSDTVIALLPGSRQQEVDRLLPIMLEAIALVKMCEDVCGEKSKIERNMNNLKVILPVAKPSLHKVVNTCQSQIQALGITVLEGEAGKALCASDAAIVASGTATLEAMLYKTPSVVIYKTSWLTYRIAKMLVRSTFFRAPKYSCWEVPNARVHSRSSRS